MLSLIHKFGTQHQDTDRSYAIAMFVFLIINPIYYGIEALVSWGRCITCRPKKEYEGDIPSGALLLTGVLALFAAVDLVFVVRAWMWFSRPATTQIPYIAPCTVSWEHLVYCTGC